MHAKKGKEEVNKKGGFSCTVSIAMQLSQKVCKKKNEIDVKVIHLKKALMNSVSK